MHLELDDAETAALSDLLRDTIAADRFPLPPRVKRLRPILAKVDPQPVPDQPFGLLGCGLGVWLSEEPGLPPITILYRIKGLRPDRFTDKHARLIRCDPGQTVVDTEGGITGVTARGEDDLCMVKYGLGGQRYGYRRAL